MRFRRKLNIEVFNGISQLLHKTLCRRGKEFECQFTDLPNGTSPVKAVLLTPVAVDAKNLDSTILRDGIWKKEDVYGK